MEFVIVQEFKNALKEDTVDYSTYTANIKRKRPTPRKVKKAAVPMTRGGGGGRGGDDDDDDCDDDDWSGGTQRLSISGRKAVNTRSRVRL